MGTNALSMLSIADDALVVSENLENSIRRQVVKYLYINHNCIVPSYVRLERGARKELLNGMTEAWYFSSNQCAQDDNNNVEEFLKSIGKKFPKQHSTTLCVGCMPELNDSAELDPKDAGRYQKLTGALNSTVELGRMITYLEVSMMTICVSSARDY